jgi:hypothetical protein
MNITEQFGIVVFYSSGSQFKSWTAFQLHCQKQAPNKLAWSKTEFYSESAQFKSQLGYWAT